VLKLTRFTAALLACLFAVMAQPARFASAANAPTDEPANEQEHASWQDDPKFIESRKAMDEYNEEIRRSLVSGSDPRGWIVVSTTMFSNSSHPRDPTLLHKAATAALNDAFVQMMTTRLSELSSPDWSAAQERLVRLEPENGAVWLNALEAASRSANVAAVDDSLDRFAKSTRFDTHQVTLAKEMIAAFSLKPMPDIYYPKEAGIPEIQKEIIAASASYLIANALLIPQTVPLSKECAADKAHDGSRALNCDLSLRLLLTSADTFFTRTVAAKQLFERHSLNYVDNETIRNNDWLFDHWTHSDASDLGAQVEFKARMINDVLVYGNELEGMRHFLQATNIAVDPPADWIDKFAPKPGNPGLKDESRSPPVR
jgi:hypothetical protein